MTLLATFKHISSKNADYGAAEAYLTFEHDEFTMKPTLDENGRLIPREDYRISSLNCGGEDFAVACMRANLRYEKNQKREDVKSHHYIISFDPRDGTDNGLTVDRAQELGEQFCKEHFPGHQAAMARAVRSLSPVIMTVWVMPSFRSSCSTCAASGRRGSAMQMTPASTPEAARYRWEYWGSSASNFACSPAGMVQPSSSKMKWALPMTTRVPPTRLAMPCATIYSTSECISSWEMPRSLAARTTAFAMEWGKCSSRQAASCNTSRSKQLVKKILQVWDSVPAQLTKENKKFMYGAVDAKARAREYVAAVDWLIEAGYVRKGQKVTQGLSPLTDYLDLKSFELYYLDHGLLRNVSGITAKEAENDEAIFDAMHGILSEQLVLAELTLNSNVQELYFWTSEATARIDFVFEDDGEIIPVDVQTTIRKKAQNLKVFHQKYGNRMWIRISLEALSFHKGNLNVPIYGLWNF